MNIEIPELKSSHRDFIGFYENIFPEEFCDHLIETYDNIESEGICGNRKDYENALKHNKSDSFYFMAINSHAFPTWEGWSCRHAINNGLQRCFDSYVDEYDVLTSANIQSSTVKMQKTTPGQGYHLWHFEQSNLENSHRIGVWIIYLNDIDEAGETEFLYQKLRVPPKKNTAVIFPSYTHTHRGNVVHGDKSKYILTGWFSLDE